MLPRCACFHCLRDHKGSRAEHHFPVIHVLIRRYLLGWSQPSETGVVLCVNQTPGDTWPKEVVQRPWVEGRSEVLIKGSHQTWTLLPHVWDGALPKGAGMEGTHHA